MSNSYLSSVRVRRLSINSAVGLNVLEGVVHQTALATVVTEFPAAVHQVLLGERNQFACLLEVLSFERTSGAEGPARSALTL